jgi:hypothetical protein
MPSLIQRLRDSAAHYRRFMAPFREVFPGRSVARHVYLLEEAANELDAKSKFDSIAWQGCLDQANKNAATARADADRLRNQLLEAREQRDEARADARNAWAELKKPNGGFWTGSVTVFNEHCKPETVVSILDRVKKAEAGARANGAEAERARESLAMVQRQRDDLVATERNLRNELNKRPAYVPPATPHDHVIMSLDGYDKLVKQRDSAVAERDALEKELTQVCSYIDGRWVRTQ